MMELTIALPDNGKLREAIPIRAVPLVTDWFVSADLIAIALAGDHCSFLPGLTAFTPAAEVTPALPHNDWHLIAEQLQALSASIPAGKAGKYEWRHRSLSELPGAAFVWVDEFVEAYRGAFKNTLHMEHSDEEALRETGEMRIPVVIPDKLLRIALEDFHQTKYLEGSDLKSNHLSHHAQKERIDVDDFPSLEMLPHTHVDANPQNWEPPPKSIDKERGCRRQILENWAVITQRYGSKPDGRQVLRVISQFLDKDLSKPPALHTVQNKLIELRNEKLIP